jgi:hypothetical protein
MRERLSGLRRLRKLYGMVEEVHATEAQRAAAAVREVQSAIHAEEARGNATRMSGREALLADDCVGRSLAIVHEEIASGRKKLLLPLLEECRERSGEARAKHLASKLWSERIKTLLDKTSGQIAMEDERCAQAVSDESFLARSQWKHRMRANRERDR